MAKARPEKKPHEDRQSQQNGKKVLNGRVEKDKKTDYSRWRLLDVAGRQTWHYLRTEEEAKEWPQTIADKFHLGIPTGLPDLPKASTPKQAITNGLEFFSKLQLEPGNWASEYGGPLFLIPGMVIAWYVTETQIPDSHRIEITRYLFARQTEEGGWGLHIEAHSSVFGTAMNYTTLRILGVSAEDPRMVKARGLLHKFGGAIYGPHWTKFWLCVLGVCKWEILNPTPPELWLLPDWVPIAPWRWWIHMRQVFLPMSFISSKRWTFPATPLTLELRKELFVEPWDIIDWAAHRNSICDRDNYHPKSWILNTINTIFVNVWNPYLRTNSIKDAAESWTYKLIEMEDANTDYSCLGPVNAAMNLVACYIQEGEGAYSVRRHRERMEDFIWVMDEGMLMNGTNGVQNWDTSFAIQAVVDCGLAEDPKYKPMMLKALEYLETQQTLENRVDQEKCYRHPTKGAWGFSNRDQGYTVSDCTSEAIKSVIMLQSLPNFPKLISDDRVKLAIDIILTMQNASGGCASYEPTRGSELLEYLNAAEVFGRIMVEYDYPECTTACLTALRLFKRHYPDYRRADIEAFVDRAAAYIRRAQRADGSWYGSWGVCFSYAGMFALESLRAMGETCATSERVRRGCQFFVDRQLADGGWGESYKACETEVWTPLESSHVVQTAWVCIGLMEAEYEDQEVLRRAIKLIISRQQKNGEWKREAIEGVFNKSCMITYVNYKFIFPIKALGMYERRYGNIEL